MTAHHREPDHWIVRMNYQNRSGSFVLVFAAVGSHLVDRGDGLWAWALLVLQFLVYPHLVYWRARRAARPRQAELNNLLIDSLLFGVWSAALAFPLWISYALFISTSINLTVFRGLRGLGQAMLAIGAGVVLGGLFFGWAFAPATGWPATILSILCLSMYLVIVAQGAWRRAIKLHEARDQLRRGEQALQAANQTLTQRIDEVHALQAQLQELAHRDPLTGLYNRRYFEVVIDRELARCRREGEPLALMMIDIDHFKQINDTHGHPAGDEVLTRLGSLLASRSRVSDVACRFGGEEFVLVQPGMSAECALARAEDCRRDFAQQAFRFGDARLQATLSVGIALFPAHGETPAELLRQADRALYLAKSQGRDRVVLVADGAPGHSAVAVEA